MWSLIKKEANVFDREDIFSNAKVVSIFDYRTGPVHRSHKAIDLQYVIINNAADSTTTYIIK